MTTPTALDFIRAEWSRIPAMPTEEHYRRVEKLIREQASALFGESVVDEAWLVFRPERFR